MGGGGGEIEGRVYTCSKESFDRAIRKGFRVIEIDISKTSDHKWVVSHGFHPNNEIVFEGTPTLKEFTQTPICGKFTPLTLEDVFSIYSDWDGWFAIDPPIELRNEQGSIKELVAYLQETLSGKDLAKCILQVYSLDDFFVLPENNPFGGLHYCANTDLFKDIEHNKWKVPFLAKALASLRVGSISFGDRSITKDVIDAIRAFNDTGLVVSIFNVETETRCRLWRDVGVRCFNTSFLSPNSADHDQMAK